MHLSTAANLLKSY